MENLSQDRQQAERFLKLLDSQAESFSFRTFDDSESDRKTLTKNLYGSLSKCWKRLCQLNDNGAGIFVVINETKPNGRSDADVTRVRAVYPDFDTQCSSNVRLAKIEAEMGFKPSIYVESSPKKHHAYFTTDGLELSEFRPMQGALISLFESDPSVKNESRVMRLPGFFHRKGDPFLTRIIDTGEPVKADEIRQVLSRAEVKQKAPSAPSKPSEDTQNYQAESFHNAVNRKAMANYQAWVPSLFPTAKPYQGGFRVTSADLGRNLQEALTFHPDGIRDFGEESGSTAINIVMKYSSNLEASRSAHNAAFWLCDQMGIEPEAMGWKEAPGDALMDWRGAQAGEKFDRLSQEAQADASAAATVEPEETSDLPAFPQDLLALPHGLGEMQAYIHGAMVYPSQAAAGLTALAIYTAFAQSRLVIDSYGGLGFNEYYMLLAPTGFGKESTRKPFQRLRDLLDFDAEEITGLQHSAPSSKQGLHQTLEEAGRSQMFLSDEFADWLRPASKSGNGGSHKQEALAYMMELYTKAMDKVHPGGAVTNKYQPVQSPRVSLYTTSTAEAMLDAMSLQHAESGAYNRFVILPMENKRIPKRYRGLQFSVPPEALEPLAWLLDQSGEVTFSPAAWALYEKIDFEEAEALRFADGRMAGRLSEQAFKMAGLIALSDRRLTIEVDDLQAAYNIRLGLYHRTHAMLEQSGAISGQHHTAQAVEQIKGQLKKKPEIFRSQLPALSRRFKELPLRDQRTIVDALVEGGYMSLAPGSKAKFISHLHSSN